MKHESSCLTGGMTSSSSGAISRPMKKWRSPLMVVREPIERQPPAEAAEPGIPPCRSLRPILFHALSCNRAAGRLSPLRRSSIVVVVVVSRILFQASRGRSWLLNCLFLRISFDSAVAALTLLCAIELLTQRFSFDIVMFLGFFWFIIDDGKIS